MSDLKGKVVFVKDNRTVSVNIPFVIKNSKYGKIISKERKFLVHSSDKFKISLGDLVIIRRSRPYSAKKNHIVIGIERKNEDVTKKI